MKYYLVALGLFLAPLAHAYSPVTVDITEPFAEIVIPMDAVGQKQSYLGRLETYPHLYEFTLTESTSLSIQARQRKEDSAEPVNLILLAVEPATGRISEITRLNTPIAERETRFIGGLGISVIESEVLDVELDAGLYRLEVSTPLNQRPYELDFGLESNDSSYFSTFGTIWQVQRHFDYWWTRYLLSTFILYQLGIIAAGVGLWYTWRKRKEITNVE